MQTIKGIGVSDSIVISKAYLLTTPEIQINDEPTSDINCELACFDNSIEVTKAQINHIKTTSADKLQASELAVFDAHLMIVEDPELVSGIKNLINEGHNAVYSINQVCNQFIDIFQNMDDEYFNQRASDISDVKTRLLLNASGIKVPDLTLIDHPCIIISNDLTPSETAQLNKEYVKGFVTCIGGKTSHASIMAKSMGIPALVGCGDILDQVSDGVGVIVDTIDQVLIIDPDQSTLDNYQQKLQALEQQKAYEQSFIGKASVSQDGVSKILAANIGTPKDVEGVIANDAEAIGLFRSEFLYMDKTSLPTEEEQFEAYKSVLEQMGDKQVIVRTLDIGGDKELDYLHIEPEMNPFLGYRAIRLCLDQTDIFITQLRALLRASVYGNLGIMFPMIATIDELRQAKQILAETKDQLISEGIRVSDDISVGIMIEIPSACVSADLFATEVDFFSIGTNDLIQYTMACDRMSEKVGYLYQPLNPSILRMIKMAIDAAHNAGIWCGMCGEMASDPIAQVILLALGLDEFSMSSSNILKSRVQLSKLSVEKLTPHLDQILNLKTSEEIYNYVRMLLEGEE